MRQSNERMVVAAGGASVALRQHRVGVCGLDMAEHALRLRAQEPVIGHVCAAVRIDRQALRPVQRVCSANASSGRPPSRNASACSTRAVDSWVVWAGCCEMRTFTTTDCRLAVLVLHACKEQLSLTVEVEGPSASFIRRVLVRSC
jgi:hypothetical protein